MSQALRSADLARTSAAKTRQAGTELGKPARADARHAFHERIQAAKNARFYAIKKFMYNMKRSSRSHFLHNKNFCAGLHIFLAIPHPPTAFHTWIFGSRRFFLKRHRESRKKPARKHEKFEKQSILQKAEKIKMSEQNFMDTSL